MNDAFSRFRLAILEQCGFASFSEAELADVDDDQYRQLMQDAVMCNNSSALMFLLCHCTPDLLCAVVSSGRYFQLPTNDAHVAFCVYARGVLSNIVPASHQVTHVLQLLSYKLPAPKPMQVLPEAAHAVLPVVSVASKKRKSVPQSAPVSNHADSSDDSGTYAAPMCACGDRPNTGTAPDAIVKHFLQRHVRKKSDASMSLSFMYDECMRLYPFAKALKYEHFEQNADSIRRYSKGGAYSNLYACQVF